MGTTSIQIDARTRQRLARLKSHPRETYDELLNKLMALIPQGDEEGRYTDAFQASLLEARLDTLGGRTVPLERVKRELGL